MDALLDGNEALLAYETLAPFYDDLTAGYDHDRWIGALEEACGGRPSQAGRVLDLGCGTGRAFDALHRRGYDVVGCDLSPAMINLAQNRSGEVALHVADMRALPDLGLFDWIVCLDDAVNYLLEGADLEAAFACVAESLAPGGTFCFDVNTERTYRGPFSSDKVITRDDLMLAWRGRGKHLEGEAPIARATIEVFARDAEGDRWTHTSSEHVQRHWSLPELRAALAVAGLEEVACLGQRTGIHLDAEPDELLHTKTVHVVRAARRAPSPSEVTSPC